MSSTDHTSKPGTTFLWVLGAFAGFAVLFWLIQSLFVKPVEADPRAPERIANSAEISAMQAELLKKMGLSDRATKTVLYDKTLEFLKSRPESTSAQVVPGSPTQLKQAAEPAPAQPAAPQN